jgi:hypothetical protein
MVDLKKLKASLSYLVKFKDLTRSVQLIAIAQLRKLRYRIEARAHSMILLCAALLCCIILLFFFQVPVLHAQSTDLIIVAHDMAPHTALRMEMPRNHSMFECGIDMYGKYVDYDLYRPRIRLVQLDSY